jgi:hypothetical protein
MRSAERAAAIVFVLADVTKPLIHAWLADGFKAADSAKEAGVLGRAAIKIWLSFVRRTG